MKRIILFLQVILLLCLFCLPCATLAESTGHQYGDAKGTADFMSAHYGIPVLIGPECEGIAAGSFRTGNRPMGRTPFFSTAGMFSYSEDIKIVDDAFSIYPPGFFSRFACKAAPKGLRLLLVDQVITSSGDHTAGIVTVEDGYINLCLGIGAFSELRIHHEIWHAIEYRITADLPDAFGYWSLLNPEGFAYTDEDSVQNTREHQPIDDWFCGRSGTANPREDRAAIIEAVFTYDGDWWEQHPCLQRKLYFMLAAAEPIFGDVYFHE
jgi:hypothetical protein